MEIRDYMIELDQTTIEDRIRLKKLLLSLNERIYDKTRAFTEKGVFLNDFLACDKGSKKWHTVQITSHSTRRISIEAFISRFESKPEPIQEYKPGQIWKTRAGSKVLITSNSKARNLSYPIYTQSLEGDILQLTEEGKYLSSGSHSSYDLVELLQESVIVDTFKPVIGECWKDLKGDIYEITNIDFSSANLVETVLLSSHVVKYFSSKGTISTEAASVEDLVEHIEKKVIEMEQPEIKNGQIWESNGKTYRILDTRTGNSNAVLAYCSEFEWSKGAIEKQKEEVKRIEINHKTNKKGDFMSKVKDQLEVNKEKFTDAAKLKAGQVINQQAIKALKKQLPVFVQGYADKPVVQLLLVNAVSIAAKQFAPDNRKLNKVADLMVGAAAFTTVDSFNIETFIDDMLKGIKLPEGILDDND